MDDVEIEWDEAKRISNIDKHGFDFRRAGDVFDGRSSITEPADRDGESRFRTTVEIGNRLWTAIWTYRDDRIRIISVRTARHGERREYRSIHDQGT